MYCYIVIFAVIENIVLCTMILNVIRLGTPNRLRSGTVHYILCVREHFYVLSYFGNIP